MPEYLYVWMDSRRQVSARSSVQSDRACGFGFKLSCRSHSTLEDSAKQHHYSNAGMGEEAKPQPFPYPYRQLECKLSVVGGNLETRSVLRARRNVVSLVPAFRVEGSFCPSGASFSFARSGVAPFGVPGLPFRPRGFRIWCCCYSEYAQYS